MGDRSWPGTAVPHVCRKRPLEDQVLAAKDCCRTRWRVHAACHYLPLATGRFGAAKPPFELVPEVVEALGPRAVVLRPGQGTGRGQEAWAAARILHDWFSIICARVDASIDKHL